MKINRGLDLKLHHKIVEVKKKKREEGKTERWKIQIPFLGGSPGCFGSR